MPPEVWDAEYKGELNYTPMAVARTAPDPDAIKQAVRLLLAAKNPILWAGQGVHYAEAAEQMAALAELIPAPVVATNPGKSAIADSHPLSLGASTRSRSKMFTDYMRKADLILAVGSSLTRTNFGPWVPPGKTLIHSTNEADDINKEYRADLGIVGDAELVLDALIAEVGRQKGGGGANALTSLKEEIAAAKKAWQAEWTKHFDSDETPINQYRVIRDLMRTVDRDNMIVTHDSGSPREQMMPIWETTKAGSYMGWGKSTQLGYGLGITMGAKLAAPEKTLHERHGRCLLRHDRHGYRNGRAQPDRHPHGRVQQRRHGRRARRAQDFGQEIRRHDRQRQLHKGCRRPQRRRRRASRSRPTSCAAIKEAVGVTQSGAPFLLECVVKEGHDFSRYPLAGL